MTDEKRLKETAGEKGVVFPFFAESARVSGTLEQLLGLAGLTKQKPQKTHFPPGRKNRTRA